MTTESATLSIGSSAQHGPGSKRAFARHYAEMVLAMFAGMAVLGGLAEGIFALTGSEASNQAAELQVILMGLYMTVPMAAWMAYRGHTRERNLEMAASMIVPSLFAGVLAAAGLLGEGSAMALQHGIMFPAMLGVMVWRYDEYSHAHA